MNSYKNITVVPPAYELLFDVHRADSIWPKSVLNNLEIQNEIHTRSLLVNCLRNIFAKSSRTNMEITTAIDSELVTQAEAESLFMKLAKFLEIGGQNARILLYLPFELIPNINWRTNSKPLTEAINKFYTAYLSQWKELLSYHDIKASFVDGDILEPGLLKEPLPKVVKAAHLTWVLVSKGLINTKKVVELIEISQDEILRQSLGDALKVIHDLNLIGDLDLIFNSSDPFIQKLKIELKNQTKISDEVNRPNLPCNLDQLKKLIREIHDEFENLEKKLNDIKKYVSDKRINWLRQKNTEEITKNFAKQISSALVKDLISISDFEEFIKECANDESLIQLIVESIGKFLEVVVDKDLATAHAIYNILSPTLITISNSNSQAIISALESLQLKLSFLGIIDQGRVVVHRRESFFLERMASKAELNKLINIVEIIKTDNQLSKMLYPILLVYGSRAKGYGNSDFDLAIFIRPSARFHSRIAIQEILNEAIKNMNIKVSFLEFWLEWKLGHLNIRDFKNPDTYLGGNHLAHVLFEAVWIGEVHSIKQIFGRIIPQFLLPNAEGITQTIRPLLLKEMERNTLQFRLMHKGYAQMYPSQGGISTQNSSVINSESSFWDSGYRRLATKLFITKVFLHPTN